MTKPPTSAALDILERGLDEICSYAYDPKLPKNKMRQLIRSTCNVMDQRIRPALTKEAAQPEGVRDKKYYHPDCFHKLPHGLYRLWWRDGDASLAVVGSLYSGKRWYSCANWTSEDEMCKTASSDWYEVLKAELILENDYETRNTGFIRAAQQNMGDGE